MSRTNAKIRNTVRQILVCTMNYAATWARTWSQQYISWGHTIFALFLFLVIFLQFILDTISSLENQPHTHLIIQFNLMEDINKITTSNLIRFVLCDFCRTNKFTKKRPFLPSLFKKKKPRFKDHLINLIWVFIHKFGQCWTCQKPQVIAFMLRLTRNTNQFISKSSVDSSTNVLYVISSLGSRIIHKLRHTIMHETWKNIAISYGTNNYADEEKKKVKKGTRLRNASWEKLSTKFNDLTIFRTQRTISFLTIFFSIRITWIVWANKSIH